MTHPTAALWLTILFIAFLALINFAPAMNGAALVDMFAPPHPNHPKGY